MSKTFICDITQDDDSRHTLQSVLLYFAYLTLARMHFSHLTLLRVSQWHLISLHSVKGAVIERQLYLG